MSAPESYPPARIRQMDNGLWHIDGMAGQFHWDHACHIVVAIHGQVSTPIAMADGRIFLIHIHVGHLDPTDPLYNPEDYPGSDRQIQ